MKVTVISAHPDDLEVACAGTLKRLQDDGAQITSIITVCPSKEINPKRSKSIVERERRESYYKSNFRCFIMDTQLHEDGRPNLVCDNQTITDLSTYVEECDIAIIPNPLDSHQDHRNTYNIAFPLVKKLAKEVWLMESYPYCLTTNSTPNLFYDITHQWQFKKELLQCYNSYFTVEDIEKVKTVNKYHGLQNNTELAEAFTIIKKHVR